MTLGLTDDKSTLVQVMAWCRQATSHYLSQCWSSSMSPCGVIRQQWVNSLWSSDQGSFCVCAQPVRDDVTMWRHLSLAGRTHKMIPEWQDMTSWILVDLSSADGLVPVGWFHNLKQYWLIIIIIIIIILCQSFNSLRPSDGYMRQYTILSLVQIMACRLVGAKPLSEPMLEYC